MKVHLYDIAKIEMRLKMIERMLEVKQRFYLEVELIDEKSNEKVAYLCGVNDAIEMLLDDLKLMKCTFIENQSNEENEDDKQ